MEKLGIFLGVLVLIFAALLVSGWVLMLGIGVAFSEGLLPSTAGIGPSIVMAFVVGFVTAGSGVVARR